VIAALAAATVLSVGEVLVGTGAGNPVPALKIGLGTSVEIAEPSSVSGFERLINKTSMISDNIAANTHPLGERKRLFAADGIILTRWIWKYSPEYLSAASLGTRGIWFNMNGAERRGGVVGVDGNKVLLESRNVLSGFLTQISKDNQDRSRVSYVDWPLLEKIDLRHRYPSTVGPDGSVSGFIQARADEKQPDDRDHNAACCDEVKPPRNPYLPPPEVALMGAVAMFFGAKFSTRGLTRGPFSLLMGGWLLMVAGGVPVLLWLIVTVSDALVPWYS
jgi:hypothetical protein